MAKVGKGVAPRASAVSTSDQVVTRIVRGLYEGQYVAGQKLVEADLTQRFGVGRSTVREAFKRLEAEGLIAVSLHKGASIRSLSRSDARDILEVVETLTGLSARLAAERLSRPGEKKMLRDVMSALKTLAANDSFEFGRQRGRFYLLLAQIAGNRELVRLLPMVQVHLVRAQFRTTSGLEARRQLIEDYEQVVAAIVANRGVQAERAMKRHIRNTARTIQRLPDGFFAPSAE
ncbi:MAG: GntR family transcriptional regulator [Enhydrobacter sp.]|nr:GntR family transcriptional regulator [Enhydrobacter sp.]